MFIRIIDYIKNMLRRTYYNLLYSSKIKNASEIPIIVNNRNRYTFLMQLIEGLEVRGYSNIIIIDNNSTYPPLLKYYEETVYKVIRLDKNLGYKSLEMLPLYKEVRKDYFVYTDPDLALEKDCPADFLSYFLSVLKENKYIEKIGFSLRIDDLPDHYDKKNEVIEWEKKYYQKEKKTNLFKAPIDTTFALHRPYAHISLEGAFNNYRTGYPYQMKHLPWYLDSQNLSDEEIYYKEHAHIGGHWTNGIV